MEGIDEKEALSLICIGYKYKKNLIFLMTKGAGITEKGNHMKQDFLISLGISVCGTLRDPR